MRLAGERYRGAYLPRRAIAALEGVLVDEGLLHRVQLAARFGEAFDRRHRPLDRDRQRQAAEHAAAVDEHRAGAALAVVSAFLGAGQPEMLAQRVEQRGAGIDCQPAPPAVDGNLERGGARGLGGPATGPGWAIASSGAKAAVVAVEAKKERRLRPAGARSAIVFDVTGHLVLLQRLPRLRSRKERAGLSWSPEPGRH